MSTYFLSTGVAELSIQRHTRHYSFIKNINFITQKYYRYYKMGLSPWGIFVHARFGVSPFSRRYILITTQIYSTTYIFVSPMLIKCYYIIFIVKLPINLSLTDWTWKIIWHFCLTLCFFSCHSGTDIKKIEFL